MKRYVKEVWVKFDSQDDYLENEEKLFAILDKAPGDCIVKVYDASARECKTLSGYNFDEKQLSLLTDFRGEESRMDKNKVISLADAPECLAAVTAFYDRFREQITGIETVEQRNNILSEMQQDFETEVRQEPQNRDKLSEIYQLLKRRCWEVGLCGNG